MHISFGEMSIQIFCSLNEIGLSSYGWIIKVLYIFYRPVFLVGDFANLFSNSVTCFWWETVTH